MAESRAPARFRAAVASASAVSSSSIGRARGWELVIGSDHALVATHGGFEIYDVSSLTAPEAIDWGRAPDVEARSPEARHSERSTVEAS